MLWALVRDNRVVEITDLDPNGRFHPDFKWYACPQETLYGWVAEEIDGAWSFYPYVPPPPTAEEIFSENLGAQNLRLTTAAQSMAPVLMSINLGDSTEAEVVLAKQWQAYYRELKLVDLTVIDPAWPAPPSSI